MKKIIGAGVFAFGLLLVYWFTPDWFTSDKAASAPKAGPGYFDFIREIQGEAPPGIVAKWNAGTVNYKTGASPLDSLVEVGPYNVGGRTRAILWDRNDPSKLLVGGISGGLWSSSDSGHAWSNVNDQEMTLNISNIVQSPFDGNIIYYTTGEGSGNSSAAPGVGVFKSTDGGQSFSLLPATTGGTFDYAWKIKHSLVDSNTLYVATSKSGLYRSQDAGASFTRVYATSREVHDIDVFEDSTVMFTVRGMGIFTSKDAEPNTIQQLTNGLPNANTIGRVDLAYCESQPNMMYAAFATYANTDLHEIYRSTDGGQSWTATLTNPTNKGGSYPFTWYCFVIQVKRDDPESVILGSLNLMASSDGGKSWVEAKVSHADYHVIETHPDRPDKLIIGNDGGVYEYSWSTLENKIVDLNKGLNITQFYTGGFAPSGMGLIGGTQDNGTHQSINYADSFSKVLGGDGSYTHIHQQDGSVAYLSTQNGNIRKTPDYKAAKPYTFDIRSILDDNGDGTIDDGAWFINPFTINYRDGEQLYFVTKKRIYRSTSGGILWDIITNNINSGTAQEAFSIGLSNQMNPMAFVGGENGLFYRIKNAAIAKAGDEVSLRSLSPVEIRTSFIGSIKVNPVDKSKVYIGMTNYSSTSRIWKILKADQDTPVWENISGDLPANLPVNWVEVDPASPDSVLFIGTNNGFYYTTNGGLNWLKDERIPNTTVDMIQVRESDRRIFIFTHGRGCYTARITPYNLKVPDYDPLGISQKKAFQEAKLYPNPSKGKSRLIWSGTDSYKEFVVVDLKGQTVLKGRAFLNQEIDFASLSSGIYYLKAEGIEPQKFLKLD